MDIVETKTLFFKEGSSDKFYTATIDEIEGEYRLSFVYGRRGASGQAGIKCEKVSLKTAKFEYDKLIKAKMSKGYKEDPNGVAYVGFEGKEDSTYRPQLLEPIGEDDLEFYLKDTAWCAQKKYDGRRKMIERNGKIVKSINRKGQYVGFPKEIETSVLELKEQNFIIDGEEIGAVFYAYDIVSIGNGSIDVKSMGYLNRYTVLRNLVLLAGNNLRLAPLSIGEKEKRTLLKTLHDNKEEGIVFKMADAPYSEGRNKTQVKFKFYSTCSCIVTCLNTKRSISLGILSDGRMRDIGGCAIPANKEIPKEGDIVEVRYLYAYKEGSLYQPFYLGVRDDISQEECLESQLKYKAENED